MVLGHLATDSASDFLLFLHKDGSKKRSERKRKKENFIGTISVNVIAKKRHGEEKSQPSVGRDGNGWLVI